MRSQAMWLAILTALMSMVALSEVSATESIYEKAQEPKRYALVIGNADYSHAAMLPEAVKDATIMTERLRNLGFSVTEVLNVKTLAEFTDLRLLPFIGQIHEGDLVIFYFSGHGFSYGNATYLVPTDAPVSVSPSELPTFFPPESSVRDLIYERRAGFVLMILDACRDLAGFINYTNDTHQPVPARTKGLLTPESIPSDTIIAYAAGEGQSALPAPNGQESYYTRALAHHLDREGVKFRDLEPDVTYDVQTDSMQQQRPWFSATDISELFLKPSKQTLNDDLASWRSVLAAEDKRPAVEKYLAFHRVGLYAAAARQWLKDNKNGQTVAYTLVSPLTPELAWSQTGSVTTFNRFGNHIAVPRTLDLNNASSEIAAASQEQFATQEDLLRAQGEVILLQGTQLPNAKTGRSVSVRAGTHLFIAGDSPSTNGVVAKTSAGDDSLLLSRETTSGTTIIVGKPLIELVLTPPPGGSETVTDVAKLSQSLKQIGVDGNQITWVSVSTPKSDSARSKDLTSLQALHAKYILETSGITASRITMVEGLSTNTDGVRVRIFGTAR